MAFCIRGTSLAYGLFAILTLLLEYEAEVMVSVESSGFICMKE